MSNYKFTISASDQTKAAFKSVQANLKKLRGAVNGVGLQVGALAGGAGLGLLVNNSLQYADSLAKTADRLGLTTEALAGLQHAAQLSGASTQTLNMSLQRMTRRVAEAAMGTGEAKTAIKELGLDAQKLAAMSPDQQFREIAGAMQNVSNQGDRVRLAMKLFDSEGVKLLNTLQMGKEGLDAAAAEADKFGLAISRVDAAKAEAANDAILRSQQAIQGVGLKISTQLAPYIVAATKHFTELTLKATDGTDWITKGIDGVSTAFGVMADGIRGIEILFQGAKIVGVGFGAAIVGAIKLILDGAAAFANGIKDGIMMPIRAVLEAANKFGLVGDDTLNAFRALDEGFKFQTPEVVTNAYQSMVATLDEENVKLHNLMMQPLPSEGVTTAFESVKQSAIEAGQVIDENINQKMAGGEGANPIDVKLQAKLEKIQQAALTELEILQQKEEQELAILQQSLDSQLINYQQYLELKYKTEQKFEKAKVKAKAKSIKGEKDHQNALNAIAKVGGEKGAKIAQGLSLKNTIVSTHEGAMSAYKAMAGIPIIGPALGAAAYAAVWAAGLKSQQGIKSMSAGGGSAPSVSNSAAPNIPKNIESLNPKKADEKPQQVQPVINFQVAGDLNSNDANKFLQDVKDMINNGDFVLIDPSSRNGQELAGAAGG